MLDLISRVEPEYQEDVRRNVILAGGGSQIPGLAAALEKTLDEMGGGRVRAVEDPVFAGSNGGLAIALDAPETDWESLAD
jgi:rod shape-determining protein MreB